MTNYPKLAPIVQDKYAKFEDEVAKRQAAFEQDYLKVYKKNPKEAHKMLTKWSLKVIKDAEDSTEDLTNEIFTIRTTDIQKAYFFANRKKKDLSTFRLEPTLIKLIKPFGTVWYRRAF